MITIFKYRVLEEEIGNNTLVTVTLSSTLQLCGEAEKGGHYVEVHLSRKAVQKDD